MKTLVVTLLGGSFALAMFGAGCNRADASVGGSASASGSASAAVPPGPMVEVAEFKAEAKPIGQYVKGTASTFELVVTAKSDFHVNPDYPAKFKADADSEAVKYSSPKLEKAKDEKSFALEACKADASLSCVMHITVPFTPAASGKSSVGGTVSFGLCNKDKCLVEKAPLELPITVK